MMTMMMIVMWVYAFRIMQRARVCSFRLFNLFSVAFDAANEDAAHTLQKSCVVRLQHNDGPQIHCDRERHSCAWLESIVHVVLNTNNIFIAIRAGNADDCCAVLF